jgi:streptogramin lyase
MIVGMLNAGCSSGGSSVNPPVVSEAPPTAAGSTSSLSLATTTTSIDDAAFDSSTALAFDDEAVFGRSVQVSRGRKDDRLVRIDRRTGGTVAADTVTSPLAAIRAGRWLFVVAFDVGKPCTDGCAAKLLRLDPLTLNIEQSLPLDRATASLTIVGNTLWVPIRQGVVRVAIDTGEILTSPVGEFDTGETIVGLTAKPAASRVYAVVAQGRDRYALAALDPTTGRVTARGSTIGSGPGGAAISHGDDGLWFSIATGMLGYSVRVDPDSLTRLDVELDSRARPTAEQGVGVLWVDESWSGFLGCADPATGTILWRQNIQATPVSFARDTAGRVTPFHAWTPIEPPAICRHG